jgi:hypothetical protein
MASWLPKPGEAQTRGPVPQMRNLAGDSFAYERFIPACDIGRVHPQGRGRDCRARNWEEVFRRKAKRCFGRGNARLFWVKPCSRLAVYMLLPYSSD